MMMRCSLRRLCLLLLAGGGLAIEVRVSVPAGQKKCYGEQAAASELLVIDFEGPEGQPMEVTVMNQESTIWSDNTHSKAKTAFTTNEAGPHWMCIKNPSTEEKDSLAVKMKLLAGPAAKDYTKIAKKEHLEPTQIALKRVEENLRNYHNNVLYMRAREERMRKTNDSTAFRVIGFCLFNVMLMISVGGWQMFYFKRFFRSKKII
mmetsp:Transcript_42254/g.99224  ORF Transcript_42254/g.99224 Transcript_42254/m.99224 type:complete len:204 (-) Transcript_42254:38-649(-)